MFTIKLKFTLFLVYSITIWFAARQITHFTVYNTSDQRNAIIRTTAPVVKTFEILRVFIIYQFVAEK